MWRQLRRHYTIQRKGDDKVDTLNFFREMYGKCKEGWLTIWTRQDKRTQWFPVTKLEQATETAKRLSTSGKDVYFGVGLRREPVFKETKDGSRYLVRGENEDVIAIPGFWIDIDIASEAHKNTELPQSIDEALQLFEMFNWMPSILVHSGYGLHAYWLLDEPWYFTDEEDRLKAKNYSEQFQSVIRSVAANKRGWKIDNTSDLARVLRVPGTTNYKIESKPLPVKVIKVTQHGEAV